jgi:hypothetical protein
MLYLAEGPRGRPGQLHRRGRQLESSRSSKSVVQLLSTLEFNYPDANMPDRSIIDEIDNHQRVNKNKSHRPRIDSDELAFHARIAFVGCDLM